MTAWQFDAPSVSRDPWDVCIVGGGPAGAMAAIHIARAGARVLLLERAQYPREKVCGDALIADSIRVLDRAGLLGDVERRAHEISEVQVFSASGLDLTVLTRALVIKRVVFDEILVRAAAAAGAVVAKAHVETVIATQPAAISIRGETTEIRARIAVIATGADIELLRHLGMVARATPTVVAIRQYVRSSTNIDRFIFWFDRAIAPGYFWLFPLGRGEYNVGCGAAYGSAPGNLKQALHRFVHEFPPLRAFGDTVVSEEPLRGAKIRSDLTGTLCFRPPNVLAIGESIGTTLPLTGEGIGKAMESGELVAAIIRRALEADDLSLLADFPASIHVLRKRYRGYAQAERWIAKPWVGDLVAHLSRRSSHVRQAVEAVLNDTADPSQIFSFGGILKAFK